MPNPDKPRMKQLNSLLSIIILLIPFFSLGQNPLGFPLIHNYNKAVFQGGSRTWDIKQDSRGIMYFANNEGLITFNGKYWKRYTLPNHTIIRSIFIDKDDRIYCGGQGELGYFEADANTDLKYISLKDLVPAAYQQFSDIWNTVMLGQSVFFRATNVIFELNAGHIKAHKAVSEWNFMGMADQRLFAQDSKHGFLEFKQGQWQNMFLDNPFQGIKIAGTLGMPDKKIVISTLNNKSYVLAGKSLKRMDADKWQDLYTPSAARINADSYVVATATAGVVVRDMQGRLKQRIGVLEGLQNNNVGSVFVDAQNNIWAAVDNAIAVISYGSALRYFRPNVENDITGYSTRVFQHQLFLSSSNGVYVAPLQAGIRDHSVSASVFSLIAGTDGGEAWRLEELNGQLLLGHNRGLYTLKDKQIKTLSKGAGAWMLLPLSSVYPVQQTLVGTYSGLDLLTYADHNFTSTKPLSGLTDSYRFLERDAQGVIWASHPYRGIYRIRLSLGDGSYKADLLKETDGLPSSFQNYVFKIKNQVLFSTEKGIYHYDAKSQKFKPTEEYAVFRDEPIKYLKDDQDGNIWFCTGKKVGVARFEPKDGQYTVIYFPEIEGLNTSGFENIYPYDRNNVYIGSEKGVIHINYEKYLQKQTKPRVLLSAVVVRGSQDSLIFKGYYAAKSINDAKEQPLKMAAAMDAYHFEYATPNFGIHEHLTYSYFLDGYDKDWSSWSIATEKDYTNLSSGTYTFQVKVRNNLNQESDIVSYTFIILPPWYKSIWAFIAYLLIAILTVFLLIRWQQKAWLRQRKKYENQLGQLRYIHQLEIEKNEKEIVKLQNEKLETEVQTKTKELASTSMQLMENSGALSRLRVELAKLNLGGDDDDEYKRVTSLLRDVEKNSSHWDQFSTHFDELNDGFLHRLKDLHQGLSRNDLKVCAYLRLNFTSKQIAQLQSISVRGVEIHRYRLRKKLGLDTEQSISAYLSSI